MIKYNRAVLAITAVVSVVVLLFYRYEYNKLRHVLEVFNYFGKPNQRVTEVNCTNSSLVFSKLNMRFEEPSASWQRLENDLYVYSAYSIRKEEVVVIGFGSIDIVNDIGCVLFLENENKPTVGTLKRIPIIGDSNKADVEESSVHKGYRFVCTHSVGDKVPVGISFFTKSMKNWNDAHILSVKSLPQSLNHTNVGVCVVPPLVKPMPVLDMVNFISFHDLVGMDNFIVYDFGIPNELNSYMKELSLTQSPYLKFTYTTIPWNFPFPNIDRNLMKDIIQTDCLYRTYNKVMYMTTLSWEEYIVLKYHRTLTDIMSHLKKYKLKADRYKLTTLTFCTQQADETNAINSTLMLFRKTRYDPNIVDSHPTYIHNAHEVLRKDNIYTRGLGTELIALNRYKYCDEKTDPEINSHDTSILKFSDGLKNSRILKKLLGESRFSLEIH